MVIWARDADNLTRAVEELRAGGTVADGIVADIGCEDSIVGAFHSSLDVVGGRVDSVFANAGTNGNRGRFVDIDLDEWRRVVRINLDGTFLTFREAARHMVPAGGGALVAVTSTVAIHGAKRNHAYGASKTGVHGLVRALATELAPDHIRVNALVPGFTLTEMSRSAYDDEKFRDHVSKRTPIRRWADPSEMGYAAVFLADPAAVFHTGDSIVVDGGYTIF